ncbi:hypothetical protein SAMN02910418_00057 [Bowdeniella nasicola]|uniref:DUF4870 domain-containing protein n=1 Tax=Bowdeniella nasicola TaxID=208480 RepID=A0A1H3VIU9_9ACTO|nr:MULTISPECIES: DUF4870 domain-containing protein [Bowdeniella]SDZ74032.1 hypothetical protein SAMN02910418_00057 [Bowdeniella nasicola]
MSSYQVPQGYGSYDGSRGEPGPGSEQDKTLGMLTNLSPLIAMVITVNFASLIAPWVMWLLYKEKSPFVRRCAAHTFNFDLSMWVVAIIGWAMILSIILSPIGIVLVGLSGLAQIILHIVGALQANKGLVYNYPMQFFKVLN